MEGRGLAEEGFDIEFFSLGMLKVFFQKPDIWRGVASSVFQAFCREVGDESQMGCLSSVSMMSPLDRWVE